MLTSGFDRITLEAVSSSEVSNICLDLSMELRSLCHLDESDDSESPDNFRFVDNEFCFCPVPLNSSLPTPPFSSSFSLFTFHPFHLQPPLARPPSPDRSPPDTPPGTKPERDCVASDVAGGICGGPPRVTFVRSAPCPRAPSPREPAAHARWGGGLRSAREGRFLARTVTVCEIQRESR